MTTRHTFTMNDTFTNQRNGTENDTLVRKVFETDNLADLVMEFTHYLWHCGYTYVDSVEVHNRA